MYHTLRKGKWVWIWKAASQVTAKVVLLDTDFMMCMALSGRGAESGAGRQPEVTATVVLPDIDFTMCMALSARGAESGAGRQPVRSQLR